MVYHRTSVSVVETVDLEAEGPALESVETFARRSPEYEHPQSSAAEAAGRLQCGKAQEGGFPHNKQTQQRGNECRQRQADRTAAGQMLCGGTESNRPHADSRPHTIGRHEEKMQRRRPEGGEAVSRPKDW